MDNERMKLIEEMKDILNDERRLIQNILDQTDRKIHDLERTVQREIDRSLADTERQEKEKNREVA